MSHPRLGRMVRISLLCMASATAARKALACFETEFKNPPNSVTDAWANRIIGDRQPHATKTYTFTSPKFYKSDSKLVAAELLGPAKIIRATQE